MLTSPLSRTVQGLCANVLSSLRPPKHVQLVNRSIVEFAHLDNFQDLVELKLNPLNYEGFSVGTYIGFTKEVQTNILQAIVSGNPPKIAAECEGISEKKLKTWMDLGEQGIEPFHSFFIECIKAFGFASAAQMRTVLNCPDAALNNGAKWWLERMRPELYAKKETTVTTSTTQINQVNFMSLKPEERMNLVRGNALSPSEILRLSGKKPM